MIRLLRHTHGLETLGVAMAFMPPLSRAEVRKAERRFVAFIVAVAVGLVALLTFEARTRLSLNWLLYWLGLYLAACSAIHELGFDIRRSANPHNQPIDPQTLRPLLQWFELGIRLAGLLGLVVVGILSLPRGWP